MPTVSRTLTPDQVPDGAAKAFERLLRDLGAIQDGGLTIILLTGPAVLEQIDRPELTIDLSGRGTKDVAVYVCMCGWETDNVPELANHLARHGARRLTVTPENWKPK